MGMIELYQMTPDRRLETLSRGRGIGGSDIGPLMGVSYFRKAGDVWDGIIEGTTSQSTSAAMQRGIDSEELIVHAFANRTGLDVVYPVRTYRDTYFPWLRASLDGIINGSGEQGVLEVKSLGETTFSKTLQDGVSMDYQLQIQYYMAMRNMSFGWFAIHCAAREQDPENPSFGEDTLLCLRVEADPVMGQAAISAANTFWKENVLTLVRPETPVAKVPTWSVSGANAGPREIVRNDPEWAEAVQALETARDARDDATALYEAAVDVVKALMGDHRSVTGAGAKISWKEETRTSFDWKRYQKDHPDLSLEEYLKTTVSRSFRPSFKKTP